MDTFTTPPEGPACTPMSEFAFHSMIVDRNAGSHVATAYMLCSAKARDPMRHGVSAMTATLSMDILLPAKTAWYWYIVVTPTELCPAHITYS